MKRSFSMFFALLLIVTMVFSPVNAEETTSRNSGTVTEAPGKHNTKYSWGNPAKSTPILNNGSARSVGMREAPLEEIDHVMEDYIESGLTPGAVTLVSRSGSIVQTGAYGHSYLYADDQFQLVDDPVEMTEDTLFDLASISKIFTTTAAMILYEQGLFELDDPVAEHIPEFAAGGKGNVTIRQLMTHISGLPASAPVDEQEGDREDRLQYVLEYPLANEPGEVYTYSDLGMITLGVLVERLSGMRLDEFVEKEITRPLGMRDTMYNPPASLNDRIAATEFQPWTGREIILGTVHDEKAYYLDGVAGHAGVFSTAKDLAILAQMYLNEGRYKGKQIIEPETVEMLTTNQIPGFVDNDHGLGWEMNQMWYMEGLTETNSLGHTGYTGTSIVINPDNETIAILLTNRVHPSRDMGTINPIRRDFAKQVAESIQVGIPGKQPAWFSGYGGNSENTLKAGVDLTEEAYLSFNTWFRTEERADYGYVEVTDDGENWTTITEYNGYSDGWLRESVTIPAGTTEIRFRYSTDTYYNGRGWYVSDAKLVDANGEKLRFELSSDSWEVRGY
ncbi:serine hydrolase domain-containing protein [Oceanobacillus massiliensis]|uniref:serine hydrolase domain-containing protein n=1 Tax=Oceanobacillus massiliensis TaxID=1465765 RepID=UPI00028854DC|nr:serine hydrolase domain-containing protein [Oceanobacillus massiliensis]